MIKSRICDLIGIQYPIFQGGMAWISDAVLASAVSEAGGLGIISAMNANAEYVREEIRLLKEVAGKLTLKVIIETCLLTDEEKVLACTLAKEAGADFVKTSTGFSTGGATVHDVKLMRETVGPNMGVKASGGVRTHEDLLAMVEAGATRIGTSNGTKII